MHALPSSLAPAAAGSNRAASDRRRRWRDAAADLLGPAAVLVATWSLLWIASIGRSAGVATRRQSRVRPARHGLDPGALTVVIEVSALRARGRTFAMVGAGLAAAALGLAIEWHILVAVLQVYTTLPSWWPASSQRRRRR